MNCLGLRRLGPIAKPGFWQTDRAGRTRPDLPGQPKLPIRPDCPCLWWGAGFRRPCGRLRSCPGALSAPMFASTHLQALCPSCGAGLVRLRRVPLNIRVQHSAAPVSSAAPPVRQRLYRCRAPSCGWRGAASADPTGSAVGAGAQPPSARRKRNRVSTALVLLGGVGLALAASLLVLQLGTAPADRLAHPGGVHRLAPGEQFDGDPLQPVAAIGPAAMALSASDPPLGLRQDCVWGKPGRNPYQGTVEQALVAGRLPAELVAPVAARIRAHQPSDRVSISTAMIRSEQSGREFSPRGLGLSFGHTMCLNSRVNFVPGHVEKADLYEVMDGAGRRRAVMVPDVCGNVSVLSAAGERARLPRWLAAPVARWVAALGGAGNREGGLDGFGLRHAVAVDGAGREVPEPDMLACVLLGLAAAWWVGRRR